MKLLLLIIMVISLSAIDIEDIRPDDTLLCEYIGSSDGSAIRHFEIVKIEGKNSKYIIDLDSGQYFKLNYCHRVIKILGFRYYKSKEN